MKTAEDADIDEALAHKAELSQKLRPHVKALKQAAEDETLTISWPVDACLKPLGIQPHDILRAKRLSDVTWHDVPARIWIRLAEAEQKELRVDVWHFAHTQYGEDVAKAPVELAKDIQNDVDSLTAAVGVSFAFASEDYSAHDEKSWIIAHAQASLYDWACNHRKTFEAQTKEKIERFIEANAGKVAITQREELRTMLSPAAASTIFALERRSAGDGLTSLQSFHREMLRTSLGVETSPDATGSAVAEGEGERDPKQKSSLSRTEEVGDKRERSTDTTLLARGEKRTKTQQTAGARTPFDVPFGEDPARYLETVHKKAASLPLPPLATLVRTPRGGSPSPRAPPPHSSASS